MSSDVYGSALTELDRIRRETDAVLVAFSGGKESLCVLDLALKTFPRVVPFHLEHVPGLRCVEDTLDWARERYKIDIVYYPHANVVNAIQTGVYRNSSYKLDKLSLLKYGDMYGVAKAESGIEWVLTGARRSDSRQRRILMDQGVFPGVHPIADWSKAHVLAYLKRNDIPRPPQITTDNTTGIGFGFNDLIWLHDNYPEDFERFCEVFPFAPAAIHRKRFYGYGG